MGKRYNAGLYLRLSVEDMVNPSKRSKGNSFQNESTSIENQRAILTEYIYLQGWNVSKIYTDDGYSGGNFERPGFQSLIKDTEAGKIDLILVKDLSRFGRDHIEVDHYVEDVFPALGVRFIALMDGIDSEVGADILPFRSLLNDYYLKDLSRKIKSTFHTQAKAGNYIGWFVSYGYKKDPARHGRLMVDPYAADVVRRIFDLRLKKFSYTKIAGRLNVDGILAPRAYCFQSEGKPNPFQVMDVWRDNTVSRILKNEVYLGHSVKMKTGGVSYKQKKRVNRPAEDWIRVENTHEAIVSQDIWDAVHAINLKKYDSDVSKPSEPSLFSGLLVCDNGHSMCCGMDNQRYKGKVKRYRYYYCPLHKQSGGEVCSWHTISELALLRIVREDMARQLECIEINEGRVVAEIQSRLAKISLDDTKKELQILSTKLVSLDERIMKLYEDKLKGIINLDTFKVLSNSAEAQQTESKEEHKRLSASLEVSEQQRFNTHQWISGIRSYLAFETPDRSILRSLIEKIEIGEREGNSTGKGRQQAIRIYYRFVGYIG